MGTARRRRGHSVTKGATVARRGASKTNKKASVHWFDVRGITSSSAKLHELVVAAVGDLAAELKLDSREELTGAELEALARGGVEPRQGPGDDPLELGAAEYAALLATSLDVGAASERAGVTKARIRQRLTSTPRSLVGVRRGNNWRIPLFQFTEGGGLLPGIERVVEAIDPGVHALAIQRWFLGEHVDLPADEDEQRHLSPRDWLRLGRDPRRLTELAREL